MILWRSSTGVSLVCVKIIKHIREPDMAVATYIGLCNTLTILADPTDGTMKMVSFQGKAGICFYDIQNAEQLKERKSDCEELYSGSGVWYTRYSIFSTKEHPPDLEIST